MYVAKAWRQAEVMPDRYEITSLPDKSYKLHRLDESDAVLGPFSRQELKEFLGGEVTKSDLTDALNAADHSKNAVRVAGEKKSNPKGARPRSHAKPPHRAPRRRKAISKRSVK